MSIQLIKQWIKKNDIYCMIMLWVFFSILWYFQFGFNFNLEGEKYRNEADYLLQHHSFSQARFLFYSTTISIIAFTKLVFQSVYPAIIILLAFNLWCYVQFYKGLKNYFQLPWIPLLIIFILLSFWPFQSWTMYLYTENIFYSLILLLFASLLKFQQITLKYIISLFCIITLLILSRPLGILFIPPVIIFLWFNSNKKQKIILAFTSIVGVMSIYFISQVVFTTTPDWTVQRSFMEENLICDVPTVYENKSLDTIQSSSQLKSLFYYITHNFKHFSGLAIIRLKLFFLMTRDYYSFLHNTYLLVIILPIYTIVIIGLIYYRKLIHRALLFFIITSILLFAVSIAMQCDDYHNRFFLCIFPLLVFMLGAILNKWKNYFLRKTQ